jgi:hypothetical protein
MSAPLFWEFMQRCSVVIDLSEQPVGSIFKGQAVQELL